MSKSELIASVIRLDREVNRSMRQPLFEGWKGINLTIPQLKSLSFISNNGTSNPGRLATALGVTPPNITGIVDRLFEQGLITRHESQIDRRVLLLQTTEKGEDILSEIRDWRIKTMHKVLTKLNDEELQCLVTGLSAMVEAARQQQQANTKPSNTIPIGLVSSNQT